MDYVTTCVVVWIEMYHSSRLPLKVYVSPPAWWCGLKCLEPKRTFHAG